MRRTPTQRAVAAVLVAGATGAGVASPMGDMRDRVASLSGGGYSRTRNVVRRSKYMNNWDSTRSVYATYLSSPHSSVYAAIKRDSIDDCPRPIRLRDDKND